MQSSPLAQLQAANLYVFTVHNPVRFIDPSGLLLQINPGGRDILFDSVQTLTNDTLHIDDRGFVTITYRVSDDLITLRYGTQLIRNIIDNPNDTAILHGSINPYFATVTHSRNHNTGNRTALVSIDINRMRTGLNFVTRGEGRVPAIHTINLENDFHIVVAHELIHADRRFQGLSRPGPSGRTISIFRTPDGLNVEWLPDEENFTIGITSDWNLARYSGRYLITENRIRNEHGLNPRTAWRAWVAS